jgi:hypothetical protein
MDCVEVLGGAVGDREGVVDCDVDVILDFDALAEGERCLAREGFEGDDEGWDVSDEGCTGRYVVG